MFQRGQQDFPIAWIVRGFKIMKNTSAREEQTFTLLDSFRFHGVKSYATAARIAGTLPIRFGPRPICFPNLEPYLIFAQTVAGTYKASAPLKTPVGRRKRLPHCQPSLPQRVFLTFGGPQAEALFLT